MTELLLLLGFIPLLLPAALLLYGALTGRIDVSGIWRDSFNPAQFSAARAVQFFASLAAAAAVFIGLGEHGGTAFAPFPNWLFAAVSGTNAVYLGSKYAALQRLKAQF